MLFVCIYLYDFCRNFGCLSLQQHKPLAGLASLIPSWCKHLLTVLLFFLFFFIKCLLSVMNVFISGPELTSSEILLNVWDWGGGRTPILFEFFCFGDFKLRIKMRYKTEPLTIICEGLWEFLFPTQWWCMAFYSSFSVVQSASLVYVSLSMGVFVPMYLSFHWMCTRGVEL